MSKNDGGPAFPCQSISETGYIMSHYEGMALRDYFAAAALQGLLANPYIAEALAKEDKVRFDTWIETQSYVYADAMLKAREVKL
jgi:hypothetical protein